MALRLLIRFWGTRGRRDASHKGRDGEVSHRFVPPPRCWLRNLADLGAFPRTVGENGQNGHKGGFSIWGSTPPAAFDPMGNLVTAAWVPGDLASCQSIM